MASLFDSVEFGDLKLRNRIVMAPLTRQRAHESRNPNAMMVKYYADRASAGLILTEATSVTPRGVGYIDTPGIWSGSQVEGWKEVTKAVHEKGGLIVMQLWHVGRISHSSLLDGQLPVAPSAIAPDADVSLLRPKRRFETPEALSVEAIQQIVEDVSQGAENAKRAGFDGVEIHGANGYLQDQFLQSSTNLRTDDYGGSVENRARFLLQTVDAAIEVWGPRRVGVHLAPRGDSNWIGDTDPKETFGYVARELKKRGIAFIFIREGQGENYLTPYLRQEFGGPVVANQQLTKESAEEILKSNGADAVSFGRPFIANPDLVERLRENAELNEADLNTFYSAGEKGYNDYPTLSEVRAKKPVEA
ncbi:MAG: alkene reductase [Proteobacteria bacterium]|nr:MAG: alkene reductase [Pseudomonadota bacterium]